MTRTVSQPGSRMRVPSATLPKRPLAAWLPGVAAIVAGCAIAPQPAPAPTLQVPAGWRAQTAASASTSSPAASAATAAVNPQWWHAFGDPVLDQIVARALAQNTDLRVARARVAEYRARLDIARSAQSPALGGSFSPARARARTPSGAFATSTIYQVGAQASYEVDLWGRLDRLSDAAIADLQGQQAAADAAALAVTATAATAYLNLRGLDAQLQFAQATLVSRQESLARARRLLDLGYTSRVEWVQAESEYRAAAGAVPALQRAVTQQENALRLLLGESPGDVARGVPLATLALPAVDGGLPSELLRRRPDIAQAEFRVVSSDASLAAARDLLLPSLQLSVSGTLQGLTLHQLLNAPYRLWSVGGSVLTPVLQGRRLHAATEVAAAQRDQAALAYEQVVRNAFAEVENALTSIDTLRQQLVEADARGQAAAEALRIARNRYRNGYATYLEELDAQRTSYTAQLALLQTRASLLTAHVDLYRALGGGWQ